MNPLEFIDSTKTKKHLLLVYDDIKKGYEIEFHFIKRGLEDKEICIYLTHGEVGNIRSEMVKHGIDVKHFERNNLLYIYQIQNPLEDSTSILDGVSKIMGKILPNHRSTFRIVGRLIPDVGIEEAITIQVQIEKIFHTSMFEKFNGSVLCTYDLSQIQANNRWRYWLDSLQSYHHATILNLNEKNSVMINQN